MLSKSSTDSTGLKFLTQSGQEMFLIFDESVEQKYKVTFLQRLHTRKGPATVIGVTNYQLWFWVDGDTGISYWDDVQSDVFKCDGFFELYSFEKKEWPRELTNYIYSLFNKQPNDVYGLYFNNLSSLLSPREKMIQRLNDLDKNLLTEKDIEQRFLKFFREKPSDFLPAIKHLLYSFLNNCAIQAKVSQISKNYSFINAPSLLASTTNALNKLTQIETELEQSFPTEMIKASKMLKKQMEEQKNALLTLQHPAPKINHKFNAELEKIRAILEFLCNALLNVPHLSGFAQEAYQRIMKVMGEFIYNQGPNLFEDDEILQSTYPLLFLIIAGVADNDTYKQLCYLKLLSKKDGIAPHQVNLENHCIDKPFEFISFYKTLMDVNNPFLTQLNALIEKGNCEAKLEYAKLLFYRSKAEQALQNNNNDQTSFKKSKEMLIALHSLKYKPATLFLEKHFSNDFDFILQCYLIEINYFKDEESLAHEKFLLQKASSLFTHYVKDEYTGNEVLFAYYLYLDAKLSNSKNDLEKAFTILCCAAKNKNNIAINKLSILGDTDGNAALMMSKTYWSALDNIIYWDWIDKAASLGNAEANFLMYRKNQDNAKLIASAKSGYPEAIAELNLIANKRSLKSATIADETITATYVLGIMYKNGEGVPQNYELAKEYFMNIYFAEPKARLQLLKIAVENVIKFEDDRFIRLIQQSVGDKETSDEAIEILKKLIYADILPAEVRNQAALTLAKELYFAPEAKRDLKKSAELMEFCLAYNPNNMEFIQVAFFNSNFRSYLMHSTVLDLFNRFYKDMKDIFTNGKLIELVSDFISRNDEQLNELLVTTPILQEQLSDVELCKLLSVLVKQDAKATNSTGLIGNIIKERAQINWLEQYPDIFNLMLKYTEPKQICSIMVELIKQSQNPKSYLDWLEKNRDVLLVLLKNPEPLTGLNENKLWQQFIQQESLVNLIKSQQLFANNNNNNSNGFFKPKINEKEFIKKLSEGFVQRKLEVYNTLFFYLSKFEKNDSSPQIEKLEAAFNKMNSINTQLELDSFIKELAEIDDFFVVFVPKTNGMN